MCNCRKWLNRGFTLIEMLLVIAIIGILVTMLAPRLAMMGEPRVTAAARVVTQMTRYARTMALLHQGEMELNISADGKVVVKPAGRQATPVEEEPEERRDEDFFANDGFFSENPPASAPPADDDISVERELDSVKVTFLGYQDGSRHKDPLLPVDPGQPTASVVRFRSNGTCRPHRYRLEDTTGSTLYLHIDLLGTATVAASEDELRR